MTDTCQSDLLKGCYISTLQKALQLNGQSAVLTRGCQRGCWGFLPNCTNGITLGLWFKASEIPHVHSGSISSSMHGIVSTFHFNRAGGFAIAAWKYGNWRLGFYILDPYDGKDWYLRDPFPQIDTWYYYAYTMDYDFESGPKFNIFKDGNNVQDGAYRYSPGDKSPDNGRRDTIVFGNLYVDNAHNNPSVLIDNVILIDRSLGRSSIKLLDDNF